jgi:hypothetical protein
MVMGEERWRPVPGWPGYEVSDQRHARSIDRQLPDGRRAGGVVLAKHRDRKGYPYVHLYDGKRKATRRLHVLVALAWLGPAPRGKLQVRHLDGDKENCCPWNLKYGDGFDQDRDKKHAGMRVNRSENKHKYGIGTEAYRASGTGTYGTGR